MSKPVIFTISAAWDDEAAVWSGRFGPVIRQVAGAGAEIDRLAAIVGLASGITDQAACRW